MNGGWWTGSSCSHSRPRAGRTPRRGEALAHAGRCSPGGSESSADSAPSEVCFRRRSAMPYLSLWPSPIGPDSALPSSAVRRVRIVGAPAHVAAGSAHLRELELVSDWLIEFARHAEVARRPWDDDDIASWIGHPLEAYRQAFDLTAPEQQRLAAAVVQRAGELVARRCRSCGATTTSPDSTSTAARTRSGSSTGRGWRGPARHRPALLPAELVLPRPARVDAGADASAFARTVPGGRRRGPGSRRRPLRVENVHRSPRARRPAPAVAARRGSGCAAPSAAMSGCIRTVRRPRTRRGVRIATPDTCRSWPVTRSPLRAAVPVGIAVKPWWAYDVGRARRARQRVLRALRPARLRLPRQTRPVSNQWGLERGTPSTGGTSNGFSIRNGRRFAGACSRCVTRVTRALSARASRGATRRHRLLEPARDDRRCEFNVASPRVLGTWRAWGVVADDGRLVLNQSLLVTSSHGTIELQGVTGVTIGSQPAAPAIPGQRTGPTTGPTEVLSVTGGAGNYRGINGEAQVRSYCSDPSRPFRYDRPFCIQIIEARHR